MEDGDDPTTLLGESMSTVPPSPGQDRIPLPTSPVTPAVPGYEILGELGRGGMGVVYKARETFLDRIVALKMIASGALAGPEERRRFLEEARLVAQLKHPGIVQILEAGEVHGRLYFTMEFVDGGSLAQRVNGVPQNPEASAGLVGRLAVAMQHAHEMGIVHRDLKPANILLSRDGEPKVTDFGLAKAFQSDLDRTESGAVLGTPGYMAPEQALGKSKSRPFGPAVDVYGLGSILYECLTGRPPFLGETVMDALRQVVSAVPLSPSRLRPGLPRDLETICLKCLEKEPWRRYAMARDLAEDLRRFGNHEPIVARPPGPVGRAARWCRRHPTTAILLATLMMVVVIGFAAVTGEWLDADHQRWLKEQEHAVAVSEAEAKGQEAIAKEQERGKAEAARKDATAKAEALAVANDNLESTLHIARLNLAYREWQSNAVRRAEQVLDGCDVSRRGWEWRYLKGLCHGEAARLDAGWAVESLSRSGDGRVIAAGQSNGDVTVWFRSNDDKYLAVPNGPSFRPPNDFGAAEVEVASVSLSPDGKLLAAASTPHAGNLFEPRRARAEVKVWQPVTAKEVFTIPVAARAVAFNHDGSLLAVAREGKSVELWDVATRKLAATLEGHEDQPLCVAFSPDGARLASGDMEGVVKVWDVKEGRELFSRKTLQMAWCVALSKHGDALAAGGNAGLIDLWLLEDGGKDADKKAYVFPTRTLRGHTGLVRSVCFHPLGAVLASASHDGTVKVWETGSGREHLTIRGHADAVTSAVFTPDGKQIISAGRDLGVRFWDAFEYQEGWSRRGQTASISPSSDLVATTREARPGPTEPGAKVVAVSDTRTGKEVTAFKEHKGEVLAVAFGPDGQLASSGRTQFGGQILIWEPTTGKVKANLVSEAGPVHRLAFSPDGMTIAAAVEKRDGFKPAAAEVHFWDLRTNKVAQTVAAAGREVTSLCYSPDGKLLAVAVDGGPVKLLDARTGLEVLTFPEAGRSATFNADGTLLATTGGRERESGQVWVWDVATGKLAWQLTGHAEVIFGAAFSPDGKRLATAGGDGQMRLWDTALRQEVLALPHPGVVNGVAFSRDGEVIVSTGGSFFQVGYTKIWRPRAVPK